METPPPQTTLTTTSQGRVSRSQHCIFLIRVTGCLPRKLAPCLVQRLKLRRSKGAKKTAWLGWLSKTGS